MATEAKLLTEETVPAYLSSRHSKLNLFPENATLTATAIEGGNVNYAFLVRCSSSSRTCFVKQAPEFVAIFGPGGYPLTSARMRVEIDVFDEWKAILGEDLAAKYLPTIHLFDETNMAFVMEFFEGFELLDRVLVESGTCWEEVSRGLGDFMGRTHAATHSSLVPPPRTAYLTEHFENRAMRDVQLEFVFTKAYAESTDEQREGLDMSPEFLAEVELLKTQYDGRGDPLNLVLSHGDLHPGSVMVDETGSVKIIDPEFAVYASPGLDLGSMLSGYVLAAIHQAYAGKPQAVASICEGARAVWEAYEVAAKEGGVEEKYVSRAEIETVGFTVAEVCRTALGHAGGRKWLQFEDPDTKKAACKAAMRVVNACMIKRHEGGMQLLLDQMKACSEL